MAEQTTGALATALNSNFKTTKKKPSNGSGQYNDNPVTINNYDKSEVISALQKAIRRGNEAEALYWAQELMDSGEAYRMWRRLVVIAAEDVGIADPDMCARIMTMKQAHDFGRESNIPFLAIMLLCRSPKNREADDAAYYYDQRRKAGWRIQMPAVAIDGHTRRGRTNLYNLARSQGADWMDLFNREFYYDAALMKGYVEDTWHGKPDVYRQALMEFLRLPFKTYDIESCDMPRQLSGGARVEPDALIKLNKVEIEYRPKLVNPDTGEIDGEVYMVKSFTDPKIEYEIDLTDSARCSCPSSDNGKRICKHILALEAALQEKS